MKSILADPVSRRFEGLIPALSTATAGLALAASPARAHAFGARYDLPLPLLYYLIGAGAAVALSFVVMALVFRGRPARRETPAIDLLQHGAGRALRHPAVLGVLRVIAVGLFLLVLASGLWGAQEILKNFAPTFVWIVWWVGFAFVAALVGNLWPAVNPWSIIYAQFERSMRTFRPRSPVGLGLAYPAWLAAWPAVVLFGLFAWLELISETAKFPGDLAGVILIYSVLTWLGMFAFGREVWLARGEAFTLVFGVFGRFAPFAEPERAPDGGAPRRWLLRPYAAGLVVEEPPHPSVTVFILLMLSTVTYDGLKETPFLDGLLEWIAFDSWFNPAILLLHDRGLDFQTVIQTALLFIFPILFVAVFLGFSWLTKWAAGSRRPVMQIAGIFVFTLVPIAIAYHLAHYLSYLLLAGQRIIPLASDPFGAGWDLFGTADYRINIALVGAKFVWYNAVAAIVVGHVFAVAVAHFAALRLFETPRAALRSQYPMLALMVGYTIVSLWILSQPVVESPELGAARAQSDSVKMAPLEFKELCLDLDAGDEIAYAFQSDRPVDFDIHYHDASFVQYPVELKHIVAVERSFVAESAQSYCLMWSNTGFEENGLTYRVTGP